MGLGPSFSKFTIHPNIIRQVLFICILIFLGITILKELYFMIGSFLGAVTLYVILMYPMKYLTIYKRWPAWIAALSLMLLSLVIMIIPIGYLTSVVIDKLDPVIQNPSVINESVSKITNYINSEFNVDIIQAENIAKFGEQVIPIAQKTLGGTFSTLGNMFLMYLVLYFMLVQSQALEKWLRKNLPFKTSNVRRVITGVRNLVYSNAIGIPIVAIIQGFVGGLGYWIFGVEEFILMGILTAISSVIPIVGTLVVYLPLAIFQYITAGAFSGIGVAAWGFAVIGSVDNVARFLVQKKLADVHPLITLLGVIIGINMFGFIGVVFGPLLLSVFFMLFQVYIDEFGKVDANKFSSNNNEQPKLTS